VDANRRRRALSGLDLRRGGWGCRRLRGRGLTGIHRRLGFVMASHPGRCRSRADTGWNLCCASARVGWRGGGVYSPTSNRIEDSLDADGAPRSSDKLRPRAAPPTRTRRDADAEADAGADADDSGPTGTMKSSPRSRPPGRRPTGRAVVAGAVSRRMAAGWADCSWSPAHLVAGRRGDRGRFEV